MIAYIVVTVLNSSHAGPSKTSIKASAINAMREVAGNHCALSHKDIEEEVIVAESCAMLTAQANAKGGAGGKKGAKGWFNK